MIQKDTEANNRITKIRDWLYRIRAPKRTEKKNAVIATVLFLLVGIVLGMFAKWLDNLALDDTIWWHRIAEKLDLGNFFSEMAVWLLAALLIAVFSRSAFRAAWNVFAFFAGMCAAYHAYTILFSGFNPASYMLIWYGITLVSPILAVFCWYARGSGPVPILLDIVILAVFLLACFGFGFIYITFRGILYCLVFIGAAAALYRTPKQLLISLPIGFLLAFVLSPVWPFQ